MKLEPDEIVMVDPQTRMIEAKFFKMGDKAGLKIMFDNGAQIRVYLSEDIEPEKGFSTATSVM